MIIPMLMAEPLGKYGFVGHNLNKIIVPQTIGGVDVKVVDIRFTGETNGIGNIDLVIIPYGVEEVTSVRIARKTNQSEQTLLLPNGVTDFGNDSELINVGFNNVILPKSLTYLGKHGLAEWSYIKELYLGFNGTIDKAACQDMWDLQKVEFGGNEIVLRGQVFEQSDHLESVYLQGVKEIPDACFANCSSLSNINIPYEVEIVQSCAFKFTGTLGGLNIEYRQDRKWGSVCFRSSQIAQIPNGLNLISGHMFTSCHNLKDVIIPGTVDYVRWKSV